MCGREFATPRVVARSGAAQLECLALPAAALTRTSSANRRCAAPAAVRCLRRHLRQDPDRRARAPAVSPPPALAVLSRCVGELVLKLRVPAWLARLPPSPRGSGWYRSLARWRPQLARLWRWMLPAQSPEFCLQYRLAARATRTHRGGRSATPAASDRRRDLRRSTLDRAPHAGHARSIRGPAPHRCVRHAPIQPSVALRAWSAPRDRRRARRALCQTPAHRLRRAPSPARPRRGRVLFSPTLRCA